jgi:hypothetical protein
MWATVRNFELYWNAARERRRFVQAKAAGSPEYADQQIGGLTIKQVRKYRDLPTDRRDEWFDRGPGWTTLRSDRAVRIRGRPRHLRNRPSPNRPRAS